MTSKPSQDPAAPATRRGSKGRGVLDPAWEEELERGRAADEEAPDAGSIEPELAMLHLLRHAREPEALSPGELDAMWSDISEAVAPESSWLTRIGAAFSGQWARWLMPVAGAAAVLLIVQTNDSEDSASFEELAMESKAEPSAPGAPTAQDAARAADANEGLPEEESAARGRASSAGKSASSTAAVLEQQFNMLEARGREQVESNVQSQRTSLRSALIGQARGGGK